MFSQTMRNLIQNISDLCMADESQPESTVQWHQVVLCIITDTISNMSPEVVAILKKLGVYQDGIAKTLINEKPVVASVYEVRIYTVTGCWSAIALTTPPFSVRYEYSHGL